MGAHGITAVIDPTNKKLAASQNAPSYTTEGLHGYFLNHTDQARRVIEEVGSPHLALHLDIYHMQMREVHLAQTLRENIGLLRHVQMAGLPGRHEPSVGDINFPYLFALLDELGYTAGGSLGYSRPSPIPREVGASTEPAKKEGRLKRPSNHVIQEEDGVTWGRIVSR